VVDYIAEHDFDIVAMTETWLRSDDEDKKVMGDITPSGYKLYSIPRKGRRGGGVALLYKETIDVSDICDETVPSFESLSAAVTTEIGVIRLVVIYRLIPNSKHGPKCGDFFNDFAELVDKYAMTAGPLLFVGDFNIHWDVDNNTDKIKLHDLLQGANLHQHVSEETHKDGHTIDLVITRSDDTLIKAVSAQSMLSDHSAIHVDLVIQKPRHSKKIVKYRKFKAIDHVQLSQDLERATLELSRNTPLDDMVKEYNEVVLGLMDHHAPLCTHTMVSRPSVPWYNDDITEAKRKCRRLERQWRNSRLTVHREMFQTQREHLRFLIDSAKSSYFNAKIVECTGDQKRVFKIANDLLHIGKCTTLPKYTSSEQLAKRFSDYFVTKITKIREKLDSEPLEQVQHDTPDPLLQTFKPATQDEIRHIVKESSNASCNLDPWPTTILKDNLDCVLPVLTDIVNKSLSEGQMPSSLKEAILRPLLKKPGLDSEVLKNYRPISNLAFLSKLIEKVVAARITEHMTVHQMHEPLQSAYKAAHSTESALLRVQNDILTAMDQKKATFLVLLDLSAAFDTVDHPILIQRMSDRLRIGGTALSWFKSYLEDRTQKVSINDALSLAIRLLFGVPQGSVLGPLLYLIYTLPIGDIIRRHRLMYHLYADDTQLYVSFDLSDPTSMMDSQNRILNCVAEIKRWMALNKLKLNADKTEVIMISSTFSRHQPTLTDFHIGDDRVSPSVNVRNLGVVFDIHLSMNSHITKVCSAAYYHLRNICRIRNVLTLDSAKSITHAFVTARLDYCNSLLSGMPQSAISKVQRVQNMAAKMMTRMKKFDHVTS
jgi:hypothetical protein